MSQIILLPGLAAAAWMWESQARALAPWHPAVTDVHARHATIPAMAEALLRECEGDLILCGASMGGMVAMEAARQAPDRTKGMALLGTTARPETPEMRAVREAAITMFEQGRIAEVIEPNIALAFHPSAAASLADRYLDLVVRAGAEQLIRQNRAVMVRPDARVHLPRVACPTLVLCGDSDLLSPPDCSSEIAGLVPGAQLEWLPQCGHMLTMERPDAVNASLLACLEDLEPRD